MAACIQENDCIERFRNGEPEAFLKLYEHYARLLLSFLRTQCKGNVDFEEVAQETWIKVWKKRQSYRDGNFRAWLITVARNTMKDSARKLKRHAKNVELSDNDAVAVDSIVSNEEFELSQEQAKFFKECLEEIEGESVMTLKLRLRGLDDMETGD